MALMLHATHALEYEIYCRSLVSTIRASIAHYDMGAKKKTA